MGIKVLASFAFCLVAFPLLAVADTQGPATQQEQESYSIGYQVGLSMKSDGVEAEMDHLMRGLRDALDGQEAQLSMEEMKRLIVDLRKRARETETRKIQELIVRNAEESEKFLRENKEKEGIRSTESGLQFKVLQEGSGVTPGAEDMVKVHYRGMFVDGREFDSSYAKGAPQIVQADGVIKGWTEALAMMKVGSKWQLFVPPELAYGRGGLGQKIPPNQVLVFEIELLSIENDEKTVGKI
jgi:FKBP-type peptidyl-prolyl cis-trans isomerase